MSGRTANWIKRYYESDHYFHWYLRQGYFSKTQKEVDFIVSRMVQGGRVLDIGCGHGRHCIEFAKRGFEAVGIDVSKKLIAQARRTGKRLPIQFIINDARQMNKVRGYFDLIVSLFSSFGLHSHMDNCLLIHNACVRLKHRGFLLIDVDNIHEIKKYISATEGVYKDDDFVERVVFNPATNIMQWEEHWRGRVYSGKHQLYTREQLSRMIEKAGLKVKQLFGSFEGEEYS
ncbi:methyltransferase domain-containing protein, partial [Patescibacteria group bacterium]|nr:methyltransferase domain-containing protein [Patescibacteria group bacterium]MBU1921989.1 methyltransferase domain-containing protein [Patescibacteria group bacterium]